jgi:hypothetical protein
MRPSASYSETRSCCFACHLKSVQLGSVYRGGDKDFFRDVTEREFNRKTIEEGRAKGHEPVPVNRRQWI